MGGFRKKKKRDKAEKDADWRKRREHIEIVKENARFEEFYLKQNIMDPSELPQFLDALRRPLPQTFRFAGYRSSANVLLQRLDENYMKYFEGLEIDGEKITKPQPLPWYPDGLAWFTNLSRAQLRRHSTLTEMHRFLIAETESGYVTRQEAVSMIPPLFMDISSDHAVLDLCAAPGSKTAQLMELMHENDDASKGMPNGLCIANDRDNKRCYMLVHQAKRLNSPACIITNHDATMFPGVVTKDPETDKFIPMEFDRILADVPCTGDGTMRKNYDIWSKWTPENSISVHGTQVKILKRALELLKLGGRVVYSTCSMSPLEDEAVVAHILSQCKGSVELVDCSKMMPELKRRKGISKWSVELKDYTFYDSYEQIPKEKTHVMASLFPPPEAESLNLDRCMRFLPHDQDTGGFFVCVLEKKERLPWETGKYNSVGKAIAAEWKRKEAEELAAKNKEAVANGNGMDTEEKVNAASTLVNGEDETPPEKKAKIEDSGDKPDCGKKEDGKFKHRPKQEKCQEGTNHEAGFFYFEDHKNHRVVTALNDFYQLSDTGFPSELLVARSDPEEQRSEKGLHLPRQLYMTTQKVKEVLQHNRHSLKFINAGVRVFSKTDIKHCEHPYRIAQDGMEIISKYLPESSKRWLDVSLEDLITLLSAEHPDYKSLSEDLQTRNAALDQVFGSILIRLNQDLEANGAKCQVKLTAWRGKGSLRVFVNKFERRHYLHLLNAEVPESIDLKASKNRGKEKGQEKPAEEVKNGESVAEPVATAVVESKLDS